MKNFTPQLGILLSLVFLVPSARALPLALIYSGPGSCNAGEGDAGRSGYTCAQAAADVAKAAGFRTKFIGPTDVPNGATEDQVNSVFEDGKVWIQPGGVAQTAYYAMTQELRTQIVSHVKDGGGYVGFCAGAFMATARIGNSRDRGFGIFPGSTFGYSYYSARRDVGYAFLETLWNGVKRKIYFEGGPYLWGQGDDAEITAKFTDGYAVAGRAAYGKGRVYITGGHPEAPAIWSEEDGIKAPDGSGNDLAIEMIQWAAGLK